MYILSAHRSALLPTPENPSRYGLVRGASHAGEADLWSICVPGFDMSQGSL